MCLYQLSTGQMDRSHSTRPARSSSVSRFCVSSTLNSTYSSNRSTSILNTSSAFVSSYIRPSSITHSSSTSRPFTPSTRTTPSRSSTPSNVRSGSTISSSDKIRQSQNSRSSTPTSRSQIPSNSTFSVTRSNSRPSTPTQRSPSSISAAPSISVPTGVLCLMDAARHQHSDLAPLVPGFNHSNQLSPLIFHLIHPLI